MKTLAIATGLALGLCAAPSAHAFCGYAIRHPWTGPINCMSPRRGIWGGPPGGEQRADQAATNIAFAPRGNVELPKLVAQDVPEIGVKHQRQGCGCSSGSGPSGTLLAGLTLFLMRRRRREETAR